MNLYWSRINKLCASWNTYDESGNQPVRGARPFASDSCRRAARFSTVGGRVQRSQILNGGHVRLAA